MKRLYVRLAALLLLTVTLAVLAITVTEARSADKSRTETARLEKRKHRQERSIHRHRGTLEFFARRPHLARTSPGRRALLVARAAVVHPGWLLRELGETRAAIRARLMPAIPHRAALLCIHRGEGAWDANTGNGYYGGLQMDMSFQHAYGPDYLARWGTADRWPVWAQLDAGERAIRKRGFSPWPATARACGLL